MKGHGGQPSLDWPNGVQYFRVAVVGNGANAPVAPAGKTTSLTSSPDFILKANALSTLAAEIPTRSGTGVYTVTYDASFTVPAVLTAPAEVYGSAGMWAAVTSVNTTTRVITVSTFNNSGTATDLTSSMMLVIALECRDSTG